LARLDRKRAHKGSNEEWEHPHDPDARITKMKDGRTHLAHKVEQAVDFSSGLRYMPPILDTLLANVTSQSSAV
jgi:hypothetical protein